MEVVSSHGRSSGKKEERRRRVGHPPARLDARNNEAFPRGISGELPERFLKK
jgi:hypothetical protein